MKAILSAGAALVLLAGPVYAQSTIIERRVIDTPAPSVQPLDDIDEETGSVNLDPDQEVIIRRHVIEEQPAPYVEIPRGQVTIGSAVPPDVPLHPMGRFGSPSLARFAYFVSPDQKIVVVEPQTRRVVKIVKGQ